MFHVKHYNITRRGRTYANGRKPCPCDGGHIKTPPLILKGESMELNTILTLINAGYTKAEIDSMTGTEQGAGQQTEQGAAGQQEQQNGQGAEQKDNENITELTKQIMALSEVVKGLQTQNAKRAESAPPEKLGAEGAIKGFFGVK